MMSFRHADSIARTVVFLLHQLDKVACVLHSESNRHPAIPVIHRTERRSASNIMGYRHRIVKVRTEEETWPPARIPTTEGENYIPTGNQESSTHISQASSGRNCIKCLN